MWAFLANLQIMWRVNRLRQAKKQRNKKTKKTKKPTKPQERRGYLEDCKECRLIFLWDQSNDIHGKIIGNIDYKIAAWNPQNSILVVTDLSKYPKRDFYFGKVNLKDLEAGEGSNLVMDQDICSTVVIMESMDEHENAF